MRILIISCFFPPVNSIASLRPYSWAKYWTRKGCDVSVLSVSCDQESASSFSGSEDSFRILRIPSKFDSMFNFLKKYNANNSKIEIQKSAPSFLHKVLKNIFEQLICYKKQKGFLNSCRMPDKTDFWVRPALNEVLNEKPWDLVVSTSGPYTTHRVAYELKKKNRASRWIADFRDPWSDNKIFPGIFPFRLIESVLEKRWMRKADLITTVSPILRDALGAKHGIHKTHVIESGVDFEDFTQLDETPIFPNDGKFRIVHTGTVYDGINHPVPLLEALEALGDLSNYFEVIFCGVNGALLPAQIARRSLNSCVKLLPPVKREDALRMQRDADALLFLPWGDVEQNGIISGKIFEYLYTKNPIIAVGGQSEKNTIQILEGIFLEPAFGHDVNKIKKYLLDKIDSPNRKEKSLSRESILKYSRKALAEEMLNLALNVIVKK